MKDVEFFMLIEIDYILACAQNKQLYLACNDQQLQLKLSKFVNAYICRSQDNISTQNMQQVFIQIEIQRENVFEI